MKNVPLIALVFALVPLFGLARNAEIFSNPSNGDSIAQGLPNHISNEQESGMIFLAQGAAAACSVAGNSGTKRKCPTKVRTLSFPVTIGVYR